MRHSSIAQLVEQSAVNRSVVGSSPTQGAILPVSLMTEQWTLTPSALV